MAKREYRDKTGKLLGYSQNESDRVKVPFGKIGAFILLLIILFPVVKHWLGW